MKSRSTDASSKRPGFDETTKSGIALTTENVEHPLTLNRESQCSLLSAARSSDDEYTVVRMHRMQDGANILNPTTQRSLADVVKCFDELACDRTRS
ncbi:hypothetical protein BP00DRAFT_452582 [Aspergillus indologenus CBS 114.80]|uniref:Uncharacterized protein n=1 Tax=Aspergillus indologenus CBS 114.80 TaxID=1450541 RepID=A0A2V5HQN7_9EURO|nr:hypothetical protein BP00DRAFT_452582 [Aspergillus indologenus CBS 114.80]